MLHATLRLKRIEKKKKKKNEEKNLSLKLSCKPTVFFTLSQIHVNSRWDWKARVYRKIYNKLATKGQDTI